MTKSDRCRKCNRRRPLLPGKRHWCKPCTDEMVATVIRPAVMRHCEHEPTEAELDALIAERSRPENLPRWWTNGHRKT